MRDLNQLLRGRWQIPLLLTAIGMTAIALLRLSPTATPPDFPTLRAEIEHMRAHGYPDEAVLAAENLLSHESQLTVHEKDVLHQLAADTLYDQLHTRREPDPQVAARFAGHMQAVQDHADAASVDHQLRLARGLDWAQQPQPSADAYRRVLSADLQPDQRRGVTREFAALLDRLQENPDHVGELGGLLQQMLNNPDADVSDIWWALQRAVRDALKQHDLAAAESLLSAHGAALQTTDLRGYIDHLQAAVLVEQGRIREAMPLVDWVDFWLRGTPVRGDILTEFGHLPAMNRVLAGQIHLAEDRPQQALEAFIEALAIDPSGRTYVPGMIGRAEALAALQRHEEAQDIFRIAAERLHQARHPDGTIEDILQALERLAKRFEQGGDYAAAIDYLRPAVELARRNSDPPTQLRILRWLGETSVSAAQAAHDPGEQRALFEAAGRSLQRASAMAEPGDEHGPALLWSAAQAFDAAGRNRELRQALRELLAFGPADPRRPAALLQLGQALEAVQDFSAAINTYDQLHHEFPKLEEAVRGQIHKVDCLLAGGENGVEPARRTLLGLLEDASVAPDAAVFHDALLGLGTLQFEQGQFADAIGRFESFLERYPDDPQRPRARYLLADAYRRSAYSLMELAEGDAPRPDAAGESRTRFREAVRLYRDLHDHELAVQSTDEAIDLYRRLAVLNEAECLKELNEPATLSAALGRYRQIAAEYERTPTALMAQVHQADLHLRQGDPVSAARALERCRWLMQGISDEAFEADPESGDRRSWEQYLAAVSGSPLLRDVFAGP